MSAAALPEVLSQYLKTCTPQQIAAIISSLPPVPTGGTATVTVNASNNSMKSLTTAKTKKRKLATKEKAGKPLRPLNSWMAFRAYYSPIFIKTQQKAISGLMTKMWKEDPFKAKWTLLASAYSAIREHVDKVDAPLDEFLRICAPHVGIIEPVKYLELLGWQVTKLENDVSELVQLHTPELSSFHDSLRTCNLSVEDLVNRCHEVGYITLDNLNAIKARSPTLGMKPAMTVAQPAKKKVKVADDPTLSSPGHEEPQFFQPTIDPASDGFATLAMLQRIVVFRAQTSQNSLAAEVEQIVGAAETQLDQAAGLLASDFVFPEPNIDGNSTSAGLFEQQNTVAEPEDKFPYYATFHPDYPRATAPSFDPLVGDPFDVYDIVNPDAFEMFMHPSVFEL